MDEAEAAAFLSQERTVTCATAGPRGWPHLMPLWYVLRAAPDGDRGPRIWAWTYAVSQKVRNLERDPRATLLVESGEQYQELRGVMFECEVTLHTQLRAVTALGLEIFTRYAPPGGEPAAGEPSAGDRPSAELRAMVERQAAKRVGLEFRELRRASWDHRKLGGTY
jgi:hypothetical protein